MNPFFFGTSKTQLFGVYHPPERDEIRDGAVLLCPALGHEYIASHGSMQQLASKLARAGFHVLRFDFFGCGDSAGEIVEASVGQWLEDIATAIQELMDTSGSRRVSVVGLRLGATLAALAGGGNVFASVLWEPVVSGRDYVAELFDTNERWLGAMYMRPKKQVLEYDGPEVMGFQLPRSLQEDLEKIDLMQLPDRPAEKILIMQNTEDANLEPLQSHLSRSSNGVACELVPAHKAWLGEHWMTIALPPHDVLTRIVQWMTEVHR